MKSRPLHELLSDRADREPDRLAYRFVDFEKKRESEVSYAVLDRRARAIARMLSGRVAKGDRVILIYPSSLEYIAAVFACFHAGAIAVPVYPPVTARMARIFELIAEDSRPSLVLTNSQVLSGLRKIRTIQSLRRSRWLRGITGLLFKRFLDLEAPGSQGVEWVDTDRIDAGDADGWIPPRSGEDDVAFLQYTSGSTADPKGVILSHGNLLANQAAIAEIIDGHPDEDSGVGWLPLYHDMGLIGTILHPVYRGGSFALFSPLEFIQRPVRWLQAITKYRASISAGPNFAYELCVDKIPERELDALDLSSWRIALNGAEPVRRATIERFTERFSRCGFREEAFRPCYGLAENTLVATGRLPTGPLRVREPCSAAPQDATEFVGCGVPLGGQQLAIVDPETGKECEPGRIGEIRLASASVAKGYWNNPRETEEVFRSGLAGRPGEWFLRTGDLGFLDEGELFVTGRLKDLIILHGQNRHPHDIEYSVERSHRALRKGCAVAFSVDTGVEEALVILQEIRKSRDDPASILAAMRGALHRDHALKAHDIALVEAGAVPKTTSGKLRRTACREAYLRGELEILASSRRAASGGAREAAAPQDAAGRVLPEESLQDARVRARVKEMVAEASEIAAAEIADDDRVLDLGVDSLGAVELLDALCAEFAVTLPHEELLENPTLETLARRLVELRSRPAPAPRDVAPWDALSSSGSEDALLQEIDKGLPVNIVVEAQEGRRLDLADRPVVDFASLNYLGFDLREEIREAIPPALDRWGVHPSWSRAVASPRIYEQLEEELAELVGVPYGAVFPSISLLNLGVLPMLAGRTGALFLDEAAHSSLRQACELAAARGATLVTTRHGDLGALEQALVAQRACHPKLIVLDGVYSMSAEYADLPAYSALASRHDAFLYVDDAHGFGVLGERPDAALPYGYGGSGVARHHGMELERDRILYVAGLSKAFSSYAAFLGCFDEKMRDRIRLAAPYIFSGPIPTASLASALAGLELNRREGDRIRRRLHQLTRRLVDGLDAADLRHDNTNGFPVVFVPVGSVDAALAACREVWKRGFLITPGVFPAAPIERSGLRISVTADNTEAQIDALIAALDFLHR